MSTVTCSQGSSADTHFPVFNILRSGKTALLALLLVGCGGSSPDSDDAQLTTTVEHASYDRSFFGDGWLDEDGDCQNTRHELLIELSLTPVTYKRAEQCLVRSGKWISPFTGNTLLKASHIDIDHVVPLKWAWDHGANIWSRSLREKFANDPMNLLGVELSLNRQKGASGIDEWLPPKNKCQYISSFLEVVEMYPISLTNHETESFTELKTSNCN